MPEGVYAGCLGVSKNYRYVGKRKWKVEQCINNRGGDVLLRTNTLEDELHTRVPLLLKTKLILILTPVLRVWGSSLKFAFPLLMSSKNSLPHSTIACNVSYCQKLQGCEVVFSRENFRRPFGLQKHFRWHAQALKIQMVAQINFLGSTSVSQTF